MVFNGIQAPFSKESKIIMHTTSENVRLSTIPMKGLQYLTSPSLTSSIFKIKGNSTPRCPGETNASELPELSSHPKSSSALSDTNVQSSFSHTLSGLGPSARRLLLLDSADRETVKKRFLKNSDKREAPTCQFVSSNYGSSFANAAEASNPLRRSTCKLKVLRSKEVDKNTEIRSQVALSTFPLTNKTILPDQQGPKTSKQLLGGVCQEPFCSFKVLKDQTRDTSFKQRSIWKKGGHFSPSAYLHMRSTLTHSKSTAEPTLVHDLRQYLDRELLSVYSRGPTGYPADLLGPYREALGALIESFPGYTGILSDIRTAYENVIQCQAELLSEAYTREEVTAASGVQHREGLVALREAVSLLQKQLEATKNELEERKKREEEDSSRQKFISSFRTLDIFELRRNLEQAQGRIREMEQTSKEDLEKIVVLVGTVRACDRRMKDLESSIEGMNRRINELNDFKQLAGEAQSELQRYKEKYAAFVAASDFESMKEYLINELEEARALIRRMRRSVAVRGTQVDIMNRRVLHLEGVRNQIQDVQATHEGGPLTPRPNWKAIYEQLPELEEYSKDVHCVSLANASSALSRTRASNTKKEVGSSEAHRPGQLPQGDEVGCEADLTLPVVPGPFETCLQVEYLVEHIKALTKDIQKSHEMNEELRRKGQFRTVTPTLLRDSSKVSNRDHILVHPVAMPILGCGLTERQPCHLRATGLVKRVILDKNVCTKIIFNFFSEVVQPAFDKKASLSGLDFSLPYHRYLTSLLEADTDKTFQAYPCASHLALNLEADAHDPIITTPPLLLLSLVLQGAMPPRLCVDAVSIVNHVKEDLIALAAEQQKSKLQRQAISECIQPILELKSPEEIQVLRLALGSNGTFDLATLTSLQRPFAATLFSQACQDSMDFYTSLVKELSDMAEKTFEEDGDQYISLTNVAKAITSVEPFTPVVIIRELSENAVLDQTRSDKDGLQTKNNSAEPASKEAIVRLSDIIRVIAEAPVMRRSAKSETSTASYML